MLLTYAGRCEAQGHGGPAARAYALFAAAQAPGALRASALLRQAALIAAAGDRKRAMAIYAQVAREVPHSAASREALVRAARLGAGDQQDIDAARLALQQVLAARQRDEWDTAARELLVDIEIRANDLPAAERHLDELRAAGAGSFPWGYRRAELLFYQGRLPEAARLLDSLATAAPGHALANDALELLLACEALAADSLSREAFVAGALAERQGDPVRAQPAWTWIAAHASPAVAQLALREQARARWVAGDDEATVELCTRLATAYPSGPFRVAAQLLAAQALARAGKVHEALEQLESALLAAPEDPQAPAARLQIEALRQRLATPRAAAPRGAVGLPQ